MLKNYLGFLVQKTLKKEFKYFYMAKYLLKLFFQSFLNKKTQIIL
jgi:hypothetical protein